MQEEERKLWTEGLDIVRALEKAGHQAYLVGGCVRDWRLDRPLHDIDIATSARPEEVMALFERTLPTGLKHGTVTVMEKGEPFEVTTFRREASYSDGRRPDDVVFVPDLKEDLARRDFTFNAMALGSDEQLVDPFGGEDALRAGVVACVGEPSERFEEDALRMLRAIRFAAELGFELLPDVWEAIVEHRRRLERVAIERVSSEWDRMISGRGPEQAMHYLFKSGLLKFVKEPLPEAFMRAAERYRLNGAAWEWDPWGAPVADEASLGNLLHLPGLPDADLRWGALLWGMNIGAADAASLMRALRISGQRTARISGIAGFFERLASRPEQERQAAWVGAVLALGRSAAADALTILEACGYETEAESEWSESMQIATVAELDVKGDELSAYLAKPPGPWVSAALRELLERVASGELPNEKFSLLSAAKALTEGGRRG
jgi:tRNA nucleotidyltransferase (CCA-adding enzyme)